MTFSVIHWRESDSGGSAYTRGPFRARLRAPSLFHTEVVDKAACEWTGSICPAAAGLMNNGSTSPSGLFVKHRSALRCNGVFRGPVVVESERGAVTVTPPANHSGVGGVTFFSRSLARARPQTDTWQRDDCAAALACSLRTHRNETRLLTVALLSLCQLATL